jgi:hypothetical protein
VDKKSSVLPSVKASVDKSDVCVPSGDAEVKYHAHQEGDENVWLWELRSWEGHPTAGFTQASKNSQAKDFDH